MKKRIYTKIKDAIFCDPEVIYGRERDLVDEPFFFQGTNGRAVLLIHGWTSVPYEFRRLGKFLNQNGYTTYAPALRGHATVPKDLEGVTGGDWVLDVNEAYDKLRKEHKKVFAIGTSMGATLSVILAKNRPGVSGLVLMAMPHKIRLERFAVFLAKTMLFFGKKYFRKSYPPTFGPREMVTRVISYQTYPIKSALEVPRLLKLSRELLPKIFQPCFLLQSSSDYIVSRKSMEKIYHLLGSKMKKKKYIKHNYHTFISDINKEGVFQDILEFLDKDKKMKIAIFTNNYLPNHYGVTVSIETFRRELEKRGHRVYVFAPRWKDYADKNPNVFRYPSIDIEFKFRLPLSLPYSWKMRKILQNLDVDIVHSQHPNLLGSAAKKWSRKKKIPLVFTWHTLYDQYVNFVPKIFRKMAAKYIIDKAVAYANGADAVIAPTASIVPILRKWGVRNEIRPIATGIDVEDFSGADPKIVREKFGLSEDEIVLLLVSRLTEEKNVEFVFRAVKKALEEIETREASFLGKKIRFMVVGDGYLRKSLEKFCEQEKISEKVIFCGLVKREEIKNYYAAADVFVYASKSETQGMIVSEAMYMKLPVVAVNSTGASSLMLNKANGFLVRENEEEFCEAVLKLVENTDLRRRFGEASGKIARENFTSEACADKMLRVYEEAVLRHSKIAPLDKKAI
jgi:1,2-diacylglycerol 3-alpha-glucosyltransferase